MTTHTLIRLLLLAAGAIAAAFAIGFIAGMHSLPASHIVPASYGAIDPAPVEYAI